MPTQRQLTAAARRLARLLEKHNLRIVFAESCTGGLVSAALTRIPGISAYHCGSAVVYQVETKANWLGIPRNLLDDPGPVSSVVAREMAERILEKTPQADLAASVTGHLGPEAPRSQDGLVYIAITARNGRGGTPGEPESVVKRHRLGGDDGAPGSRNRPALRVRRQLAAAELVLTAVCDFIESGHST